VVARHTHHGVHGGEFMGIPPSGKSISIVGIEEFRIADGKVVAFWHQDDLLGLLMQLGALPAP
jgi:predicted ester cyclase